MNPPRPGTQARKKIKSMFEARLGDGHTVEDLKFATVGAWNDPFRREHGHYDPESVLRPTKCLKLIEKGKRGKAHIPTLAEKDQAMRQRSANNGYLERRDQIVYACRYASGHSEPPPPVFPGDKEETREDYMKLLEELIGSETDPVIEYFLEHLAPRMARYGWLPEDLKDKMMEDLGLAHT